ncbi:hypothetical protein IPP92_01635 [Candidatus Saccharibacteria bacterium]|jgi:hypothetical protein|nr:MAG: hypothetical protein IPP24_01455 [Candidatus Saccharibacteria bacterium]QQS70983.1 MAG: hypothetical protein IPP92_01635 [Candidatus Saccharibacteria bacterium]
MNDSEAIVLARRVLKKIIESGHKRVIVIESGTAPLIYILRRLQEFEKSGVTIHQIKIPRDTEFSLLEWFYAYLSPEELDETVIYKSGNMTRREALKAECAKPILQNVVLSSPENPSVYDSIADHAIYNDVAVQALRTIVSGTQLASVFCEPFLLFDEYINSGTVLRTFNTMTRLFTATPQYSVSAYCIFVDNSDKYEKIAFALYDKRTELECYAAGAYPYENRIDIIGYYYFVTKHNFRRVRIRDVRMHRQSTAPFYERLSVAIQQSNALTMLQSALHEVQVRDYVSNHDIARYLMKKLEYASGGQTETWDLLDQMFELHAPAWSPMPVANHLDYWNGFALIDSKIIPLTRQLLPLYKQYRSGIVADIIERLESNRASWEERIATLLEKEKV